MSRSPFHDLVAARISVRRYERDRPVSDGHLAAILEAARLAPSADNMQPWRFVVVRDPGVRARLVEEAFSGIYLVSRRIDAPVFLALCGVHGAAGLAARAAAASTSARSSFMERSASWRFSPCSAARAGFIS